MGLWDRFFGPKIDPDSVPSDPVGALPFAFSPFGDSGPVVARLCYSPDPRHADDFAALHRAMMDRDADPRFATACKADYYRSGGYHLEVPKRVAGSVPMWVRDVAVPRKDFPPDLLESAAFTPFWLRFDSPGKVVLDPIPAPSAGGRARQRIDRVRKRGGIAVRAALIQANAALYEPGQTDLPGLVLFSFDDRVTDDELLTIAGNVFALKGTTQKVRDLAFVADLTTDESFVYYRRDRLPRILAGRHDLIVAHLHFHRPFLHRGYLIEQVFDCIAEPGVQGMLELLPFNPMTHG
jgi:hypothetical protein